MIYFTSDLHFCHNKEFLYKPRGFNNVYDMNKAIVRNWNSVVDTGDDVYVLGDIMLNDNDTSIKLLKELKGNVHIITGNHDTDARIALYKDCYNVVEICDAKKLRYGKYHLLLTHFPSFTGNVNKESIKQMTLNLSGHTHSKNKFFLNLPFIYNVALDAHNCTPVSIDEVLTDMKDKYQEWETNKDRMLYNMLEELKRWYANYE